MKPIISRTQASLKIIEVALYTTGGTIDGIDADLGTSRSESDAAKWFKKRPDVRCSVFNLFVKDSRDLTDQDRETIIESVKNSPSEHILISHGSFTAAKTGKAMKAALPETHKTILIVMARKAFGVPNSDAPTQMELAVDILRSGRPGVWLVFEGRLYDPDFAKKVSTEDGFYFIEERP